MMQCAQQLERHAVPDASVLRTMCSIHVIDGIFPSMVQFRAGIALVYVDNVPADRVELLLVKENTTKYTNLHGYECYSKGFYGPPKGGIADGDSSLLETAERELLEETGINLREIASSAWMTKYVVGVEVPRPEKDIDAMEYLMYFIVIITTKPTVTVCEKEISGYKWIDILSMERDALNASIPTGCVLNACADIDFIMMRNHLDEGIAIPYSELYIDPVRE
jgi:8-oxo-dGTP pyrophosphatase MutT (NUDIX family)